MTDCAIVGAGLTPFGKFDGESLKVLAGRAIEAALADAGFDRSDIDMAFVANSVGAIVTGQVAVVGQVVLSHSGITGIPVFNIDNACAGSATALNLATYAIKSAASKKVLVVGVEKLYSSERSRTYRALNGAADIDWVATAEVDVERESVFVKEVYPGRLRAYAEARGPIAAETLARVAVKNRAHAGLNPLAQYRGALSVEQVLSARVVVPPLTTLMCAPIGDGASAVIVTDAETASKSAQRPIWIRASTVSMGSPGGGGTRTIRRLAEQAYRQAELGPADIDVAELHDATAFNELLAYEELLFCAPGAGTHLVKDGATTLGGRLPVNTSGGLESRGHPVAATGLAQIYELVQQLRGSAGPRQVTGAAAGLAEVAGGYVGGDSAAVAIHILHRERRWLQ